MMRIELNSDTGFEPIATKYLGEIPAQFLFHRRHCLRHPLGAYNVSLERVASEFLRVLDHYDLMYGYWKENGPTTTEPRPYADLLSAQRDLIYALREHIDDCHLILQCLVDPTGINVVEPGAVAFLKAAKFPGLTTFYQPLKPYLDACLGALVNRLKHKQGRLRGCMFCTSVEARLGYYLEDMNDQEVAGPSEALHPGNTAFSFARDLRLHLLHVYFASERLVKALSSALKSIHQYTLRGPAFSNSCDVLWHEIASRTSMLPLAVFPQEIQLPFPQLKLTHNELMFEYPARNLDLGFPEQTRVIVNFRGDGVTRSFRMPYYRTP